MKLNLFLVFFLFKIGLYAVSAVSIENSVVSLYTDNLLIQALRPCNAVAIRKDYLLAAASCFYFIGTFFLETKDGRKKKISYALQHPDFYNSDDPNHMNAFDLVGIRITDEQEVEDLNLKALRVPNNDIPHNAKCVLTDGTFEMHVTNDAENCSSPKLAHVLCFKFNNSTFDSNEDKYQEELYHKICKAGTPIVCNDILAAVLPFRNDCPDDVIQVPSLFKNLDWINFTYNELDNTKILEEYKTYKENNLDAQHFHNEINENNDNNKNNKNIGETALKTKTSSSEEGTSKSNDVVISEHLYVVIVCLYVFNF